MAVHGTVIEGLPTDGVISVFSAWGWVSEEDADPQVPEDDWDTQEGWTTILHFSSDNDVQRRTPPKKLHKFPAAAVEPILILSLPNHREEPALSALNWDDETLDRFDEMQSEYRAILMGHWMKKLDSFASHHLLGGYALFQQQFPEALLDMNSNMLLQVGTDGRTQMCWGDGGELTFYTDAGAIGQGRFEKVWGESQGG